MGLSDHLQDECLSSRLPVSLTVDYVAVTGVECNCSVPDPRRIGHKQRNMDFCPTYDAFSF